MNANNSMLILSASPERVDKPYYFNSTHRRMYSLEELMYHCYYYWKQSIDDFLAGKMEIWISEELKLPYLASRIEKIKDKEKTITAQYTAFLSSVDYFENDEISLLFKEVYSWENMDQWKKYKEKGDYALEEGQYSEAVKRYLEALNINDDITILNNLGIAYMRQKKYSDAMICLQKAHIKQPYNDDIIINISEVLMLQGDYDNAQLQLKKFSFMDKSSKAYNLYGEIEYLQGYYENALVYFIKAHNLGDKNKSLIRMAEIYDKLGKYNDAINTMNKMEDNRSDDYYCNYANLNFKMGKIKEAIKQVEIAIDINKKNIDAWLLLVKIHKKNRDIEQAERALLKIFEIDPDNESAKLEYATLKKSQGFIKDYQDILKGILNKWKQKYREEND